MAFPEQSLLDKLLMYSFTDIPTGN